MDAKVYIAIRDLYEQDGWADIRKQWRSVALMGEDHMELKEQQNQFIEPKARRQLTQTTIETEPDPIAKGPDDMVRLDNEFVTTAY